MTNTEIMRKFFYNLPEVLFGNKKIRQEQFDQYSKEEMIAFIDGLHIDYPTPELQGQFEENKAMWKLYYEFPSGTDIQFLEY